MGTMKIYQFLILFSTAISIRATRNDIEREEDLILSKVNHDPRLESTNSDENISEEPPENFHGGGFVSSTSSVDPVLQRRNEKLNKKRAREIAKVQNEEEGEQYSQKFSDNPTNRFQDNNEHSNIINNQNYIGMLNNGEINGAAYRPHRTKIKKHKVKYPHEHFSGGEEFEMHHEQFEDEVEFNHDDDIDDLPTDMQGTSSKIEGINEVDHGSWEDSPRHHSNINHQSPGEIHGYQLEYSPYRGENPNSVDYDRFSNYPSSISGNRMTQHTDRAQPIRKKMQISTRHVEKTVSSGPLQILLNLGQPPPECHCIDPIDIAGRKDYEKLAPHGWFKYHDEPKTWNEARKACIAEGGHLVVPRTKDEWNEIKKKYGKKHPWVGFHDEFKEGDWAPVIDGEMSNSSYIEWNKGRPDNYLNNENCASIQGNLEDENCAVKHGFICKIPYEGECHNNWV